MSRASDSLRSEDPLLIEETPVPPSPTTMDREGVLAALGYHAEKVKVWEPRTFYDARESCQRCGKKVYPVEKVDVGMLYHRGCFKCKVCGVQLNLRNFQLEQDTREGGGGERKQLFCNAHVPSRHTKGQFGQDALEIQTAMEAQKKASAKVCHYQVSSMWGIQLALLVFLQITSRMTSQWTTSSLHECCTLFVVAG